MRPVRILAPGIVLLLTAAAARGEIPLPDATLYGRLVSEGGAPIAAGELVARVDRGGAPLEFAARFVEHDGVSYFVIRVPMETAIGAPGPSGARAHEGDPILELVYEGQPAEADIALPASRPGLLTELLVTTGGGGGDPLLFRGDCNGDRLFNMSDAIATLFFLFQGGSTPGCLRACDVNDDRGVDLTDAIYTLGNLFLGGPAPPSPSGACGPDTGDSPVSCEVNACAAGV